MRGQAKLLLLIMVAAAVVVGVWGARTYNRLVALHEQIPLSWSQVQNVLQRRNDLIPNLVSTVKGYAKHEQTVFGQVADALKAFNRAQTIPDQIAADNSIAGLLHQIMAISIQYPNLKADQQFLRLEDELAGTENRIAVERMRFNDTVQQYNTTVKKFPTNLVARIGGFSPSEDYFKAVESAQSAPKSNSKRRSRARARETTHEFIQRASKPQAVESRSPLTGRHWLAVLLAFVGVISLGLTSQGKVEIFNSPLTLKVFVRVAADVPDRVLGFTPVAKGHRIRINPRTFWYVRPDGSLNARKLDRLARDIRQFGIPGVDLSDHWELTDESLRHLRALPSLTLVDLSRTKLTSNCATSLATLTNLRILVAPEGFNDYSLSLLKNLTHLRDVSLDRAHVTDEGLRLLLAHKQIENLDLSETAITDKGLMALKQLPHLKKLVLGGRITDAAAPALRALVSLEHIDVSQTQMTDQGLATLAALPNLQSVYLSRATNDRGLDRLSSSRSLETLDLSGAAITDAGMISLAKIQSLKELDLSQTPIDNAGLEAISKLANLRMLELSDTKVTNEGLAPLAKLRHLEILSLSWQRLTRNDLRAMALLPQVKTIVLNGVPLPEETMTQLHRFNHVSPWDHPFGVEEANGHNAPPMRDMALASPVSASHAVQPSVAIGGSAHGLTSPLIRLHSVPSSVGAIGGPAVLPSPSAPHLMVEKAPHSGPSGVDALQTVPVPETLASTAKGTPSDDVLSREPLKESSGKYVLGGPIAARAGSPEDLSVPVAKTATLTKKSSEDNLLNTIAKQSDPSHHGGFSGLAGLRQIRLAQNPALGDMDNGAQAHIRMDDDTPANSVGEISVGARH